MKRAPSALALLAALLVAACGSSTPSSDTGSPSAGVTPTAAASSPAGSIASTSPTLSQPPASQPPASSAPGPSGTPGPVTSPVPSGAPTASASPSGAASVCQPAGSNPSFWPSLAHSVAWDVYCAVLPKGWFVASGKYRLANGGSLDISYKGPSGATLALSEGSFCTDGSGCVPSGSDAGNAAFGGLSGTLVATDAGGFAIVVARGQQPSWLMVTTGLDQATTASLGAALARVGG